jgi:hypothetical protein
MKNEPVTSDNPLWEHNWKLFEANERYTDKLIEAQRATDALADKWIFTLAGGSFGLSFAFIDTLVPLQSAVYKPLLIAAWACFAVVLIVQFIGLVVGSIRLTRLVAQEDRDLAIKYEGKTPEHKRRSIIFDPNRVIMYAVLLVFLGGLVCLLLFVAKNII